MNDTHGRSSSMLLRDALFLGFCAVFILMTRIALRLHLKIPGHAMFFLLLFLFLARGCVSYRLSAIFTGFLSGVIAIILGIGKGGPLLMLKFILPAVVVDAAAFLFPGIFASSLWCAAVGGLAAATKFFNTCLEDIIFRMAPGLIFKHALIQSAAGILFGIAAGLCVPPIIRKLKAFGVIEKS